MARAVVKKFVQDGVVLATNIRSGVFVTFDVDNLDRNNQGNFSRDEIHGTAISVTNHLHVLRKPSGTATLYPAGSYRHFCTTSS